MKTTSEELRNVARYIHEELRTIPDLWPIQIFVDNHHVEFQIEQGQGEPVPYVSDHIHVTMRIFLIHCANKTGNKEKFLRLWNLWKDEKKRIERNKK